MPKDWSLEVQNKALRMSVRTLMENLTVEGEFKLQLELGVGYSEGPLLTGI
jgi:hypothetical protein